MPGLIFLPTSDLGAMKSFYQTRLDLNMWLDQGGCAILQHGNLLLGFCEQDGNPFKGFITLFYETRQEVDAVYQDLQDIAEDAPKENEAYRIYHFFARDPEGRRLEFQTFLHDLEPYATGVELLTSRRSIRAYKDRSVPEELLQRVFELCRWAPSSRNTQGVTYSVIRDRGMLDFLAGVRGSSSAPIGAAPMAVAVSADPKITSRLDQDACIATYHFMLASWAYGLGTCWIGGMNRRVVKERLGLPQEHYLATVTPLGYPDERPEPRPRRKVEEIIREVDSTG